MSPITARAGAPRGTLLLRALAIAAGIGLLAGLLVGIRGLH